MLYSLPDSVLIVDPDVGYSSYIRPYIYENQRNLAVAKVFEQAFFHAKRQDRHPIHALALAKVFEQAFFHAKRQDRHPIHAPFDHAPNRQFHPFWVVHGRGDQDLVVIFNREIFKGLDDLWEEWIGEF